MAATLVLFGVLCLYRSWAKNGQITLTYIGWVLIFLSLILWGFAGGKDRGVAFGLLALSIIPLGFVFFHALRNPKNAGPKILSKSRTVGEKPKTEIKTYLARIEWAILVGPVAGLASYLFSLGIYEVLDIYNVAPANALTVSICTFPIAWTGLSSYILISRRLVLNSLILGTAALFGGCLIWIGN